MFQFLIVSYLDSATPSFKSSTALATCALSVLAASVVMSPLQGDAKPVTSTHNCQQLVVGTYLATANQTNSTSGQPASYREIITFTADGNLIASDSTAGGVPGSSEPAEQPFGTVQGEWKCTSNNEIVAKALNFGFVSGTLPGYIAVTEYHLRFNQDSQVVEGNLVYNLYDLNSNPLDRDTQPLPGGPFEFNYKGQSLMTD